MSPSNTNSTSLTGTEREKLSELEQRIHKIEETCADLHRRYSNILATLTRIQRSSN